VAVAVEVLVLLVEQEQVLLAAMVELVLHQALVAHKFNMLEAVVAVLIMLHQREQ
jgi:hypothetical protein